MLLRYGYNAIAEMEKYAQNKLVYFNGAVCCFVESWQIIMIKVIVVIAFIFIIIIETLSHLTRLGFLESTFPLIPI